MATLHKVHEAKFKGTDLTSPTRKRKEGNFGTLTVSYNYDQIDETSPKEIFILVDDALLRDKFSMMALDPDEALALLEHLNELLGRPYTYPAFAGMAPSAD